MKRRVLGAAILAIALTAGALTACSGSGKETAVDTTAALTTVEDTAATGAEAETTAAKTEAVETMTAGEVRKIIVGVNPAPHVEILNAAREVLASEGYELDIMGYMDYVLPNDALNSGDLNANYLQHKPYLDFFNEQNGTKLVSVGIIHHEPFGIYVGKTSSLDELRDKATVLIPSDVSNEARALLFLEAQELIKLKEGVSLGAARSDIVEDSKNLDTVELETAQPPRSPPGCDIAVINGNRVVEAGPRASDALTAENSESLVATTYENIVAVREGDETTDATKALVETLTSPEVK